VKAGGGSRYELLAAVELTYEPSDNSTVEKEEDGGLTAEAVVTIFVS
jgi:hypothetical protein